MSKFLATFKGGSSTYSTYAYVFEIWTGEQCQRAFTDSNFEHNFYFILRDGIVYIRGGYATFDEAKNSATQWLISEDDAILDSITEYDGRVAEWIMNIDSI